MDINKSSWKCDTCNCVFDVFYDKINNDDNETNNNDVYNIDDFNIDDIFNNLKYKYDIKCMFCNTDLGSTSLSYNCNIIYKKKPNKHNTIWTLIDEITLLKSVVENKNYEYISNELERTGDSIRRKKSDLCNYIKEHFKDLNSVQQKFLCHLYMGYDTEKFINEHKLSNDSQYAKFTLDEQIELNEFIEKISDIRTEYLKSKIKNKKSIKWLNNLIEINKINIKHEQNGGEYNIPNTLYKADGYCKETNTIYEFHGCMYHGCIICFDKNSINPKQKIENRLLYEKTINREEYLKKLGYNLITIWEHDFKVK